MPEPSLTPRQQKYFASLRASLERDTGKSLAEWVAIARTCPETRPRARLKWLKDHHDLKQNHGSHVLSEAFPQRPGRNDEPTLRAALWARPEQAGLLEAVERAVAGFPDLITGQRKGYTAWSREFQFAALKPARGGAALGLAVGPEASPRLAAAAKSEGWSERLKSKLALAAPEEVDDEVTALLRASWERS